MSISRPPGEAEVRQGLAAGNRQRGGCEPNLLTQDVRLRRAEDAKNTCTMGEEGGGGEGFRGERLARAYTVYADEKQRRNCVTVQMVLFLQ